MDGGEYVSIAGEFNELKKVLNSLLAILHSEKYLDVKLLYAIPIKRCFLLLGYQRAVGCNGSND